MAIHLFSQPHSCNYPFFFYGTLREGGRYFDMAKRFTTPQRKKAYMMGALKFNVFVDHEGTRDGVPVLRPTAIYIPGGNWKEKNRVGLVQGTLCVPNFVGDGDSTGLKAQATFDQLEFNFHNKVTPKWNGTTEVDESVNPAFRAYVRNHGQCSHEGMMVSCWFYQFTSMSDIDLNIYPDVPVSDDGVFALTDTMVEDFPNTQACKTLVDSIYPEYGLAIKEKRLVFPSRQQGGHAAFRKVRI